MPAAFRLLLDSSPLMIWLSDADNRCVYFNRTWLEFTGRSLAEELGDGWLEGVHPQDRESIRQDDRRGFDSRLDDRERLRLKVTRLAPGAPSQALHYLYRRGQWERRAGGNPPLRA